MRCVSPQWKRRHAAEKAGPPSCCMVLPRIAAFGSRKEGGVREICVTPCQRFSATQPGEGRRACVLSWWSVSAPGHVAHHLPFAMRCRPRRASPGSGQAPQILACGQAVLDVRPHQGPQPGLDRGVSEGVSASRAMLHTMARRRDRAEVVNASRGVTGRFGPAAGDGDGRPPPRIHRGRSRAEAAPAVGVRFGGNRRGFSSST